MKPLRAIELGYEGETVSGTAGMAYQYSKSTTSHLAAQHRQQGATESKAFAELMKPYNVGGLWLRRQKDPEAAMASIWAWVVAEQEDLKPYLPMKERDRRIIEAVCAGVTSRKGLVRAVEHSKDWDVRADLDRLVSVGALSVEITFHGKVPYYRYALAVSRLVAWERALESRKVLARELARLERLRAFARRIKGGKRIPGGDPHLVIPLTYKEDEEIQAEQAKADSERLLADLMGWSGVPKRKSGPLTYEELLEAVGVQERKPEPARSSEDDEEFDRVVEAILGAEGRLRGPWWESVEQERREEAEREERRQARRDARDQERQRAKIRDHIHRIAMDSVAADMATWDLCAAGLVT